MTSSIEDVLLREISGFSLRDSTVAFEDLGVDSFDLISLRISVEHFLGQQVADSIWVSCKTPGDIIALSGTASGGQRDMSGQMVTMVEREVRRDYNLGMPQMAAGALSESWLFKEIGDLHWSLITDGLGTPSSRLVDGNGERLYATFTRFELRSSSPFATFVENEPFSIVGSISRFGAGIFLGDFRLEALDKRVNVRVMSSFARRENADSNRGLLKGQPSIPDGCSITVLGEKPDFINEYRRVRNTEFDGSSLFECDYQINPYHDINGVGLLYFAAYPSISDTGELAYANQGNGWASRFSTVSRDVYYFANCDAEDTLTYRIVSRVDHADGIELGALILRKHDKVPMAFLRTRKAAILQGD